MPAVPAAPRRDPVVTRRLWGERLDRFRQANQTVAQFCAAEGVSVPSFYVWKRTLASDATAPDPVRPTLVPIRLTPSPAGTPIEVVLPSGTVLRVPGDYPPQHLATLVRDLEARPC